MNGESWFIDPRHRLKKYNAMANELQIVKGANIRLAWRILDSMGGLISEEVDMRDIDYARHLLSEAMTPEWYCRSLLSSEGVGRHEHQ